MLCRVAGYRAETPLSHTPARAPLAAAPIACRLSLEDNDGISLFHGEKQQKPLLSALRRPNPAFQVIDFIWTTAKFRYAA
jgi:hypothetical protein